LGSPSSPSGASSSPHTYRSKSILARAATAELASGTENGSNERYARPSVCTFPSQSHSLTRHDTQHDTHTTHRALKVIERVASKLRGRDFSKEQSLDVPQQVQRLIDQATSHENLCQCYIGWCPFW
jgi:FKBP12-rapamycin complex-associated protein